MAKIYVEVTTPGNGKTYEFQLDSLMTVGQVKMKMINEIVELENGNITLQPEKTMLYNLNSRIHLNEISNVKTAGIKSGQTLLLL